MPIDPTAIPHIAHWVALHVGPALPILVGKIPEGAGKKIGEDVWTTAKSIWPQLHPKIQSDPLAAAAVNEVAADPDDKQKQEVLKTALELLLKKDPALAEEMHQLMPRVPQGSTTQTVTGDRNITVGGSVSGSTMITGDNHSVKPGT